MPERQRSRISGLDVAYLSPLGAGPWGSRSWQCVCGSRDTGDRFPACSRGWKTRRSSSSVVSQGQVSALVRARTDPDAVGTVGLPPHPFQNVGTPAFALQRYILFSTIPMIIQHGTTSAALDADKVPHARGNPYAEPPFRPGARMRLHQNTTEHIRAKASGSGSASSTACARYCCLWSFRHGNTQNSAQPRTVRAAAHTGKNRCTRLQRLPTGSGKLGVFLFHIQLLCLYRPASIGTLSTISQT